MKLLPALLGCLLLLACEPAPMVDPCADAFQKFQQGDFDAAIEGFQKAALTDAPHKPAIDLALASAIGRKAAALIAKGQNDAATETLRKAQGEVLQQARTQLVHIAVPATLALAASDPTKAAERMKYVLTVAKAEAAPQAALLAAHITAAAWQSASQGEFEKAAGSFTLAASLLEENTPERDELASLADLYRARVLLARNACKEARDAIVRTFVRRRTEGTAALGRAWIKEAIDGVIDAHEKAGEWKAAIAELNEAVKHAPELTSWWYTRAMRAHVAESDSLVAAGRLAAAIPPLQTAGNLPQVNAGSLVNPKIRAIAYRLAVAAMHESDWGGAIMQFEMVAGIDDKDPLVFELRAQCYEKKELWRQAAGDYDMLASLLPDKKAEYTEKATKTRAKFKAADGDRDK